MTLRQRRRQCSNAIIVGLFIMDGLAANVGNWANVIIASALIIFVLATRRCLDREENKTLAQAAQRGVDAAITALSHPVVQQSYGSPSQNQDLQPTDAQSHQHDPVRHAA